MSASLITRSAKALLATVLLAAAGTAQAATDYSDNPLAPTPVSIGSVGTFEFEVQQSGSGGACVAGQNCKDYVTFTMPMGRVLNGFKLKAYDSTDDRASWPSRPAPSSPPPLSGPPCLAPWPSTTPAGAESAPSLTAPCVLPPPAPTTTESRLTT
jgi:hypothetical protein